MPIPATLLPGSTTVYFVPPGEARRLPSQIASTYTPVGPAGWEVLQLPGPSPIATGLSPNGWAFTLDAPYPGQAGPPAFPGLAIAPPADIVSSGGVPPGTLFRVRAYGMFPGYGGPAGFEESYDFSVGGGRRFECGLLADGQASLDIITCGQTAELTWSASAPGAGYSVAATIDNGIGDVTGRNPIPVSPCTKALYTLTATTNDPAYLNNTCTSRVEVSASPNPPQVTVIGDGDVAGKNVTLRLTEGSFSDAHGTTHPVAYGGDFAAVIENVTAATPNVALDLGLGTIVLSAGVENDLALGVEVYPDGTLTLDYQLTNGATGALLSEGELSGAWPLVGTPPALAPSAVLTLTASAGCCGTDRGTVTMTLPGVATGGGRAPGSLAFDWDAARQPQFVSLQAPGDAAGLVLFATRDGGRTYDRYPIATTGTPADPSLLIDPHSNRHRVIYSAGGGFLAQESLADGQGGDWASPAAIPGIAGAFPVAARHPTDLLAAGLLWLDGGNALQSAMSQDRGQTFAAAGTVDTGMDFSHSGRAALCWLGETLCCAYNLAGSLVFRTSSDRGQTWGAALPVASGLPSLLSMQSFQGSVYLLAGITGGSPAATTVSLYISRDLGHAWSVAAVPALSDPAALGVLPHSGRLLLGTQFISDDGAQSWQTP